MFELAARRRWEAVVLMEALALVVEGTLLGLRPVGCQQWQEAWVVG